MNTFSPPTSAGYAYVEVPIAALLVALALTPAADALRTVALNAHLQRDIVRESYRAMGTMETVLAESWGSLRSEAASTGGITESSYSEPMGTEHRHIVMVSPYDVDNADADDNPLTGVDDGIVWVSVSVENLGVNFQSIVVDS